MLCDGLGVGVGKEAQAGGDICIHMADLHCCIEETNTTLYSSYIAIKNFSTNKDS